MGRPRSRRFGPPGYEEIEHVLIRLACGAGSAELRRLLATIDHPAAGCALEMVRRGRLRTAETCLEAALVRVGGDPDDSDLE